MKRRITVKAEVVLEVPESVSDDRLSGMLNHTNNPRGHGCAIGYMVGGACVTVASIVFGDLDEDIFRDEAPRPVSDTAR